MAKSNLNQNLAIDGGAPAITDSALASRKPWPLTDERTAERLKQLYLSGKWSFNGAYEQQFSRAFADFCGAKHGVFMVNGTVTLESILHALGVGKGDEVIIPGNTWMATAMAAVYVGAKPVFVDVDPDTLCLDPAQVRAAITDRTKAIIPVHIYGSMADMDALSSISRKTGIPIIEDAAHAQGGFWDGKGVGSMGIAGSFSFQQSKTLSSGEGGICLTSDDELADKLFRIKHIGYGEGDLQGAAGAPTPKGIICHNYRATEFSALILIEGLKRLKAQTARRNENANLLRELIADAPSIKMQARGHKANPQGYYQGALLVDPGGLRKGITIGEIQEALRCEGFSCGRGYGPVYDHRLWNMERKTYKIHSREVVDDTSYNRLLTFGHAWLLTPKSTIRAIAKAITKVMIAYSR